MKRIVHVLVYALILTASGVAWAVESGDLRLVTAPVNRLDDESLQRGARNFVNYCLNCHSARYMRYNRLTDLGIDESMVQDNLMFATDKIGGTMTVAMTTADAAAWSRSKARSTTLCGKVGLNSRAAPCTTKMPGSPPGPK